MSDYRYSQVENQLNGTPYGEIDLIKLSKLDKLLTKIDNDFKKKQKDITKPKLVEIMKTTHEIYQIVLYEISEMLEAARLSDLRQSLNKIYNGQNLILNYILKLNTNFEVQADKMLEQLSKQVGQPRRKSVDQGEQDQKETSKMANQMVQLQPIVKKMIRKTFGEKATDTGDDMREARSFENLQKKQQELNLLQEEADEEGKQLAEFLKNRKVDLMSIGESKAQNNLKEVLKDLGKKKRQTNDIEEEALGFEEQQKDQLQQFNQLQGTLMDGLKGMQKQQQEKAMADIKSGKALMKNGVLVYMESISCETDKIPDQEPAKFDKLRRELLDKEQRIVQYEKKVKDANIERDAYAKQTDQYSKQIQVLQLEIKKLTDKKEEKKQQQQQGQSLQKQDSDKIKKLVEENIKMKLRVKSLIESVEALEKEINRNFERFKMFITNNPNLTDEQKKNILGQAEQLFKINLSSKLNIQDMKEIVALDDLLKDPLFKQICGQDLASMQRQVKKDEQVRKQKMQRIPGYDAMFDPEFLNPGEKIVTRRVKKMVKRQNSKGEWVEEEQEVDEEVVVNEFGEELRKRDKPVVVQQSKETQQFLDAHGGFAIGGAKIMIPQKPQAKDGREIKMNEWFEDKSGKKVRKVQGKDGEEQYEVEEEYVDEQGVKRTRIKQMKIKKDQYGNDIIEEEFVGADGKKQRVMKKVTKDKDGNQIVEEVIIGENGERIIKKQKISKDKDGNEIIEEEITDANGVKRVVKKKIMKDANGNDVVIEETIDAQGNRIITTKRKNEWGEDVVEQQIIDKHGKVKNVDKRVYMDDKGQMVVEEVTQDANGNKVIKKRKVRKDKDGNEIVEEETINADGTVTVKTTKVIKNKDGSETIEEEIVDENGNIVIVKKKVYKDKNGNVVTEEERIDAKTGQKVITKTVKDRTGKETVQKQIIHADGKVVNINKNVSIDEDGNQVETEVQQGEDGKEVTVQRKIYKDIDGNQIKEEVITDQFGNKKTVKTKVIKDKDGHDIIEETIINSDGTKTTVRKKVYKDKDGNEYTEIEQIDSNGNKIVLRSKKNKNGEETVEEIKTKADGTVERTVKVMKKDKFGNVVVQETKFNADGTKQVKIIRDGVDDKQTQTESTWSGEKLTLEQLLEQLAEMGVDRSKLEQLKNQVLLKQQIQQKKQNQNQNQQPAKNFQEEFDDPVRPQSAESQKSLDTLDGDDDNEEDQARKLYEKMKNNKGGAMADLIRQVRNGLGKQGNENISMEEFKDYLAKMRQVHQKCGDNCPHLRRFYEKLGFIQKKYKRRFLKMKDTRIEAKNKLPQIQNASSTKFQQ